MHFLWKWRDMWPNIVTHTLNLCSAFTHPKCTHTVVNTHTVNTHREHTPGAVDSIYAAAPGEQLGVRCLAQGHLNRGIGGEENLEFLPDRDSSLQPFEYKSYSPTIRPQLTPIIWWMNDELCIYIVLFVYRCTPKTLYNHVGGLSSTTYILSCLSYFINYVSVLNAFLLLCMPS